MKLLNLLFVIVCLIGIVYCQTSILTKYVSINSGADGYQCGNENSPCKSIVGAVKSSNYQYYSNYELEIILMSGTYTSNKPTNLFGLNISISAQPESQVEFLIAKSSYDVVTPHFIVDARAYYNTKSTNVKFSGFSVSGSGTKISNSYYASFLTCFSSQYAQNGLSVQVDNVNFTSDNTVAPYFSFTSNYNSYSSSDNQDESSSSSQYENESSSYYVDIQKVNNNNNKNNNNKKESNYYFGSSSQSVQSSSNEIQYNSENNNNYNNNNQYTVQQYWGYRSYPTDQINNTFTFSNCQFSSVYDDESVTVNNDYLFRSDIQLTVDVKLLSSVFNNIMLLTGSILNIKGGRATIENCQFTGMYASSLGNSIFDFLNTRINFNKVDLQIPNLGSYIVDAESSLLTANAFNVNGTIRYNTISSFKFVDSMATFENCSHYFIQPYYQVQSDTSNVYQLTSSELYLLSNRISTNVTNLVYSTASSVWVNNNLLRVNYNNYLVACNGNSLNRISGGNTYSLDGYTTGCDRDNTTFLNLQFDVISLLLAFFCGVFSIALLFIVIFSISAICKCKKRKRNQLMSKATNSTSNNNNENINITPGDDISTQHNEKSKLLSIKTQN